MSEPATTDRHLSHLLNKVPEVTLWFWVIKVLCTTVGETFADYLNETLGFGLTNTTVVMSCGLVLAMWWQFRRRRYVPATYWLAVVLVSVVGTLVTDNLTDRWGVSLVLSTSVFAVLLAAVFLIWYRAEGTISIHSIRTTKRESFYWAAILTTFALGTAAGDLVSEKLSLGYGTAVAVFIGAILLVIACRRVFGLAADTAFWAAYILTRPLGGSVGDYLSNARSDGGAGLGTTGTSIVFLTVIVGVVAYLAYSGADVISD
jgi:uncharacterized membrane-anchored protein